MVPVFECHKRPATWHISSLHVTSPSLLPKKKKKKTCSPQKNTSTRLISFNRKTLKPCLPPLPSHSWVYLKRLILTCGVCVQLHNTCRIAHHVLTAINYNTLRHLHLFKPPLQLSQYISWPAHGPASCGCNIYKSFCRLSKKSKVENLCKFWF